jgi:hypothetical protein
LIAESAHEPLKVEFGVARSDSVYKNKTATIMMATGRNPIQITTTANMMSFWSSSAMLGKRLMDIQASLPISNSWGGCCEGASRDRGAGARLRDDRTR